MIVENRKDWQLFFKDNWLEHFERTSEVDWKKYSFVHNKTGITGSAIDFHRKRLILISTAGAYLPDNQSSFDAAEPLGDYSVRKIPFNTCLDSLSYAHDHYDHEARKQTPQVNLPLSYLSNMVSAGEIGEMCPDFISFSGYQPDAGRVIDETIPEMIDIAKSEKADGAIFIPI